MTYNKTIASWCCIIMGACMGMWHAETAQAQLTVVSVSPELHSTREVLNAPIVVTFSVAIDPATLNATSFRVYGHQTGAITGTFTLDAADTVVQFSPDIPYKPGEIVSVVLTDQILSGGGSPLTGGYQWEFSARPQYGDGAFGRPMGSMSPTESIFYPANTLRNPAAVFAGDLTGDAYPELAIANSAAPSVTIMVNSRSREGNVDNLYNQELVVSLPDNALDITGGDVNGDGQLDLVAANYTVNTITLLVNQTNGGSIPSMQTQVIQTTERPFSSVVADLNGDGWQDIAVAGFGSDEVAIHLNDGGGVFSAFQSYDVGQAAADIVARDITNDGAVDLIVTSTGDQRIDMLVNDGTGVFTLAQSVNLDYTPASISAFDFQETTNGVFGDTWVDILVTAQDTALVTVLEHLGDPVALTFVREDFVVTPSSQALSHVLADFDILPDGMLGPDADLDIMVTNTSSNEVRSFLNQQASVFMEGQTFTELNIGRTPVGIAAADFERDGDVDVAFVSFTDNQVRALYNTDFRESDLELIGELPDFGDVYTCQDSTLTLTFRNIRFEPITVLDFAIDMDPPFQVTAAPVTPFELAAQDSFSIDVTFSPDLPVLYVGQLIITTSDGFATAFTEVELVGQGIEIAVSATPDSVGFGPVPINQSVSQPVIISNEGNIAALVDSIVVSDPINFSADFAGLQTATIGEMGGEETLTITFMPQAIGLYSGTVTLYLSDPCTPTLVIPVSGEGISPLPDLVADSLWASAATVVAGDIIQLTGQLDAGMIAPGVQTVVQFDNDEGDPPLTQFVDPTVTGISQYTASMQLDTPGLRTITFTVDAEGAVDEADETNNSLSIQINVTPAPLPDLIATSITATPDRVELGEQVVFEGVLDIGNTALEDAALIRFEVDGIAHDSDTALPIIGVGQQVTFQSLPFTPDRTGVHVVTFIVDAGNDVDELDETNNEISIEFDVDRGSLVINPNPFTPNNDGVNEEVQVDYANLDITDPRLLIYSFEGQLIREITESNGTNLAWDGRDDSDRARPPGLYLFVLMEGANVVDSGHFTLAR